MQNFILVARTYSKIFLSNPSKVQQAKSLLHGSGEKDGISRLLEFTDDLFGSYFRFVQSKFQQIPVKGVLDEGEGGGENAIGDEYIELDEALREFMEHLKIASGVVPKSRLDEKAAGIVESAIRFQVDHVFKSLCTVAVENLRQTHARVYSPPNTKVGAVFITPELALEPVQHLLDEIVVSLQRVTPLIHTGLALLPEKKQAMCGLIQGELHGYVKWLNAVMELYTHPERERGAAAKEIKDAFYFGEENAQPPLLQVTSQFILVLGQQCTELESNGITKTMDALVGMLPGNGSLTPTTTELVKSTHRTAEKLLQHYVEMHGAKISQMLRKSVETPNWLKVKEPRDVRLVVTLVLEEVNEVIKQVSQVLDEGEQPNAAAASTGYRPTSVPTSRQGGVQLDIERIFAKKVQIFGAVEYSRDSIVTSVFKISLKTFFECIRFCTFGKNGYQQIQVRSKSTCMFVVVCL